MSDLYFNEEIDYTEENTSNHEDFRSTILQPFQFSLNRKKNRVVMRAIRKKLNIFTLQLPIYYILEQEILISASARGGCNAYCFG